MTFQLEHSSRVLEAYKTNLQSVVEPIQQVKTQILPLWFKCDKSALSNQTLKTEDRAAR